MAVPKIGSKQPEKFLFATITTSSRSTQNWNKGRQKIESTKNSIANPVRSEISFKMSVLVLLCLVIDGQCSFHETPLNAAKRIGERVVMRCGTSGCSTGEYCDHPCENLAWVRYIPNSSEMDHIVMSNKVSHVFSDHISLDPSNGNCDLQIKIQTSSDARTYECINTSTNERASAELVVLDDEPECVVKTDDRSYIVTCSVAFFGNWVPEMSWTSKNEKDDSATFNAAASDIPNRKIIRTVTLPRIGLHEKEIAITNYKCTVKFTEQGRPEGITATNVPDYKWALSFGAGK